MKLLVLQHAPHEGPGRYAQFAKDAGIKLDTVKLWEPDYRMPTPSDYKAYSGALIMGGSQGVNDSIDEYPSRDDEVRFIQTFGGPQLGVCLGSQLTAYALGGYVGRDKRKECGFYTVKLTEGGRQSIFNGLPDMFSVFHWHGDAFELPQGAKPLAVAGYDNSVPQAFAAGNKFGVLFHLEMDEHMIRDLLEIDEKWFRKHTPDQSYHNNTPGDISMQAHTLNDTLDVYARRLFNNFVSIARK